jgi:hypothetical protein
MAFDIKLVDNGAGTFDINLDISGGAALGTIASTQTKNTSVVAATLSLSGTVARTQAAQTSAITAKSGIVFVQKSTQLYADNVASIAPSLAGVTAGNLVVLTVRLTQAAFPTAIATPAGWSVAEAAAGVNQTGTFYHLTGTFYKASPAGGTESATVNFAASSYAEAEISEFSLAVTGVLDVHSTNEGLTATSATTPSVSNTQADALVIAQIVLDDGGSGISALSSPATTGFSAIATTADNATHACGNSSYKVVYATAAQTGGWTWAGSGTYNSSIVIFSIPSSGASGAVASTQAANTSVINSANAISGAEAATQAANTAVINSANAISGTEAATQAANTSVINATVASPGLTATITATQGANTSVINSANAISGTEASTQAKNASVINSANAISGTEAATQVANTSVINASVFTGTAGTVAATQAANSSAIAAANAISGTEARTQNANTTAITGSNVISGGMAATQTANTSVINAANAVQGGMSSLQQKNTSVVNSGVSVAGSIVRVAAANTSSISASVASGSAGTVAATQAANTSSIASAAAITGGMTIVSAKQTSSIASTLLLAGTIVSVQSKGGVSISAGVGISGSASVTSATDTIIVSGSVAIAAILQSLGAANTSIINANVASTLIQGTLTASQNASTSDMSVTVFTPLTEVQLYQMYVALQGLFNMTPAELAVAVRTELSPELLRLSELALINGLVQGNPAVINDTNNSRDAGTVHQTIITTGPSTTVTRL